jgi:hypothetical protein
LLAGGLVALLFALRLTALALRSDFSPFRYLGFPSDPAAGAWSLLGVSLVLGVLILLVLRHGEETVWLAGDGGGVLAPAAALAGALEGAAAGHADVVRSEAQVGTRRGEVTVAVTAYLRPYADGGRVAAELEPVVRGRLAAITGLAPGAVIVRPRVLAVRQLKRYLP